MADSKEITDGPGISELIDALKYAFDDRNPHTVEFTWTESDGSSRKGTFRILGAVYASKRSGDFQLIIHGGPGRCFCEFNAMDRNGKLQETPEFFLSDVVAFRDKLPSVTELVSAGITRHA